MNRRALQAGIGVLTLTLVLAVASPAAAMWVNWGPGNQVVSMQQRFTVNAAGETSFWATQFNFVGSPRAGGYVGVQTDGWTHQSVSDLAIFSLWGATAATPGTRSTCGTFGGEGVGYSCRVKIQVEPGHKYSVWVQRTAVRSTLLDSWSTFTAWVVNYTSRESYKIGSITIPFVDTMTQPNNFIEYFGPTRACNSRPHAAATFEAPVVVDVGGKTSRLRQIGTSKPACSREIATSIRGGVKVSTGYTAG